MKFFIFQCSLALLGVWVLHNKPSFEFAATTLEFAPPMPIDTTQANKLFQEGIAQLEQNQLVTAKELLKKAETLGYQRPYELDYQRMRIFAQKKDYCQTERYLKKALTRGFGDYEQILADTFLLGFINAGDPYRTNESEGSSSCEEFWETYTTFFSKNKVALFKGLISQCPTQAIDSITISFLYKDDLNPKDYGFDTETHNWKEVEHYLKNKKSSPTTPSKETFLYLKELFFEYQDFYRASLDETVWLEYTYTVSNKYIALIYSKQNWDYAWLPRTYYLETYSLDGKKIASRKIAWRQFYDCQTVQFDHQTGEIHATKHELKWKLGISANTRKVLTIKDIEQTKAIEQTTYFIADNGDIGMKMK